ncbi:aldehyde dehydrogenase family protein [Bacillus sp. AFS002410]|uniref:aldehyde dehydrogenase family protein n=1 Tax=Bacillus sp. AFS002410 TaxID=2033481 RepID=UPI001155ABB6|nr:aldehyde dehydrogenase family protein [Bacillus sp. AFS002410]
MAKSGETFSVKNPATGEVITKLGKAGKKDTEAAIASARKAFDSGVQLILDYKIALTQFI